MSRLTLLLAGTGCALLAGCARPTSGHEEPVDLRGAHHDANVPRDLGTRDLAAVDDFAITPVDDLAIADLSLIDSTMFAADLATTTPRDLSSTRAPDLSSTHSPDLSSTHAPDLASPPRDLAVAPAPDLAGPCVPQTSPCDVLCQNCPSGDKCGSQNGRPICEPTGTIPTGMPCPPTGDDCAPGDVCVEYSTMLGIDLCAQFCRTDADCRSGARCTGTLVGGNLHICSLPITNCDPIAQSGCLNGDGCYPVTPSGQTGCHPTGPGTQFSDCLTDFDCSAGFSCIVDPAGVNPNTCKRLCHKGVNADCLDPSMTCYDVTGWTQWGACDY